MNTLTVTKLVSRDKRLIGYIWNNHNNGEFSLFGADYICVNFSITSGEMVAYITNVNDYNKAIKGKDERTNKKD